MAPLSQVFTGWLVMIFTMWACWQYQRRHGDAGIVDVAWTYGVGALAVFFCVASWEGNPVRRAVVACLAAFWSLRLGSYVLRRVLTLPEDGRYQSMKAEWGAQAQQKLFWFYQFQAAGALLFAAPMLLAAQSAAPWGSWDGIGCGIWLVAVWGESLADRQLHRFRRQPQNRGQVCRDGLWRYSRHPNYFFEWLHWWAYVCFALVSPYGWITIYAPLTMLYFILKVTGIPPTEAQALKSRGDAYRQYQQSTSAFVPWPPRPG